MTEARVRSPWAGRVAAVLATGLLATPMAGAVGGLVLWLVIVAGQPESVSLYLLPSLVFYGTLFGGVIAAPVTLVALPIATLLLHARWRRGRWLLPALGLLAAVWRLSESLPLPEHAVDESGIDTGLLAGMAAGLLSGLLFAWMPSWLSPPGFPLNREDDAGHRS